MSRKTRRKKLAAGHRHGIKDLVQSAAAYAQIAHKGERLKYVEGIYYTHVRSVSRRVHTHEEKVVAFLHDVVENRVKKELGKTPDPKVEEALIQKILDEIEQYFRNCGHDISALRPDIDILTKRVRDADDYDGYIKRLGDDAEKRKSYIAVKVKVADLHDNMDPKRNPPVSVQKEKDKERLRRYGKALGDLKSRFPQEEILQMKLRTSRPRNRLFRRPIHPGDRPQKGKKAPLIRSPR